MGWHTSRSLRMTALSGALVLTLAGCASGASQTPAPSVTATVPSVTPSAVEDISASDVLDQMDAAIAAATSVHLTGTIGTDSGPISVDIVGNKDGTVYSGTMSGETLGVARYLRNAEGGWVLGDDTYWRTQGASDTALGLMRDKWVPVDPTKVDLDSLAPFTYLQGLQELTVSDVGEVTREAVGTIPAWKLPERASDTPGALLVAADGTALPLRVDLIEDGVQTWMAFDQWNEPVDVPSPSPDSIVNI